MKGGGGGWWRRKTTTTTMLLYISLYIGISAESPIGRRRGALRLLFLVAVTATGHRSTGRALRRVKGGGADANEDDDDDEDEKTASWRRRQERCYTTPHKHTHAAGSNETRQNFRGQQMQRASSLSAGDTHSTHKNNFPAEHSIQNGGGAGLYTLYNTTANTMHTCAPHTERGSGVGATNNNTTTFWDDDDDDDDAAAANARRQRRRRLKRVAAVSRASGVCQAGEPMPQSCGVVQIQQRHLLYLTAVFFRESAPAGSRFQLCAAPRQK